MLTKRQSMEKQKWSGTIVVSMMEANEKKNAVSIWLSVFFNAISSLQMRKKKTEQYMVAMTNMTAMIYVAQLRLVWSMSNWLSQ